MQTALEDRFSFQFRFCSQAPSHCRPAPTYSPTLSHLPAPQRFLCLQCRKRQALNWQRRLQADAAEGAKAAQRLHVGNMIQTVENGMHSRHGRTPEHTFCFCIQRKRWECTLQKLSRPWIA